MLGALTTVAIVAAWAQAQVLALPASACHDRDRRDAGGRAAGVRRLRLPARSGDHQRSLKKSVDRLWSILRPGLSCVVLALAAHQRVGRRVSLPALLLLGRHQQIRLRRGVVPWSGTLGIEVGDGFIESLLVPGRESGRPLDGCRIPSGAQCRHAEAPAHNQGPGGPVSTRIVVREGPARDYIAVAPGVAGRKGSGECHD